MLSETLFYPTTAVDSVLTCDASVARDLAPLLQRYGLELVFVDDATDIPGSYWGDREAGLIGNQVIARSDTPIHSVLHEACHYVCMAPRRRRSLHTDAGGDFTEENAVCYLQVLLADALPKMGRSRMFRDMDAWGYTFRLGSSSAWFAHDADDARCWLLEHKLIESDQHPTWRLRQ